MDLFVSLFLSQARLLAVSELNILLNKGDISVSYIKMSLRKKYSKRNSKIGSSLHSIFIESSFYVNCNWLGCWHDQTICCLINHVYSFSILQIYSFSISQAFYPRFFVEHVCGEIFCQILI